MPKRIPKESYGVLLRALQFGHSREAACGLAGLARSTFYAKLRSDERFRERVEQAEALAVSVAETAVLEAIRNGDTRCAVWFLERRARDVYGKDARPEDEGYTIEILSPPDDGSVPYTVHYAKKP